MSNAVLNPVVYEPRRPADSLLYQIVNNNLPEFISILESDPDARGLPSYVLLTFQKFLECGFYENGMTRIACKDSDCKESYWLPARKVSRLGSISAQKSCNLFRLPRPKSQGQG